VSDLNEPISWCDNAIQKNSLRLELNCANQLRLFDVKALGDVIYEVVNNNIAEISVIIPLYNYINYITECLASVVSQDTPSLSLIVIDDASTDGGGEVAKSFLAEHCDRFSSARIIRHRRNQGLAMARNSGIAWGSESFVFMLDADNRIRPPALSRLLEALVVSDAEFSYSQLYLFGSQTEVGNSDIWDPKRLIWGNYIDATALFRRQALLSAGGYRVSVVEEGWEDFDLWCRFAELGYRGIYLPELLCEYRVHESSMLRTRTDALMKTLMVEMEFRHPTLFAPKPGR
jgi:glycosyltransferase involved in cell wall biosynthesis